MDDKTQAKIIKLNEWFNELKRDINVTPKHPNMKVVWVRVENPPRA